MFVLYDVIFNYMKVKEKLNLKDPQERERLFIQYKNLMFKIVNQYSGKLPLSFDDIVGAAQEGFVKAMNTYKDGTSQSFQQYAGWCMRNNILTTANEEGHIVKFNAYQQKKAKERGESTYITQSISNIYEETQEDKLEILGIEDPEVDNLDEDEVFSNLFSWLEYNFSKRDCEIFYLYFGLNGRAQTKGIDIAKQFKVSAATVTVTNKKIIKKLKENEDLLSCLRNLL